MKLKFITIYFVLFSLMSFAQNKNSKTEIFKVFGTCIQCKNRIEKSLSELGTYNANWQIETNLVTVSYDSIKLSKLKIEMHLAKAGHDTDNFLTDESTYNNLPNCCYYTRIKKPFQSTILENLGTKIDTIKNIYTITGIVLEETQKGKLLPIVGAIVHCLTTNHISKTDSMGVFQLACNVPIKVSVSYVGFETDTLNIVSPNDIKVILKKASSIKLKEVIITTRIPTTFISSLSTLNTLNIGSKELAKAACCNLSESFETSPSVDVSYADAVTGIKQIQLLGLSGNYTQLITENTPEIKGLAGSFGLTFIPGTWIDAIQVTKGTGSVVNGYESIAGQINIEEKKSDNMEKVYVNVYANNLGRLEASTNFAKKLNNNWSTALLTHANGVGIKTDDNKDSFLDIPIGKQFNIINRWKYANTKGVFAQFAVKALNDNRQAGQTNFNSSTDKFTTNNYGVGIDVQQYTFTGKLGYVFPQEKYKSVGFIFSANNFKNKSYYGITKYDGKQNSVYANFIYQSIIGSTNHKYRAGLSFANDNFSEAFNIANYTRTETTSGAFFEYTYTPTEKFTAVAGVRVDYHNQYKFITTPRLHLKYDFTPNTNLRFSAGSGFRVANIFAENTAVFVSSRQYNIINPSNNYGYGLNPEKAWNYGFNFVHNFKFNERSGSLSLDAYRTDFVNQVVADVDTNPQQISFYNLVGKSFSNSIQAEFNYELLKKFDVRLAYRWLDVQTNYNGIMLQKPLIAQHRAFINFAYETTNKWKFDATTQWLSKKRLPNTSSNPASKQMDTFSPSFIQMAAQITKQFGKKWDVYLGAENLTNYTQQKLFIDNNQPFSPYFDGSIVWGPVNGRIIYAGMRFKIK